VIDLWPWWISTLAGAAVACLATLVALRSSGRGRALAVALVAAGAAGAMAAPLVMDESPDVPAMEMETPSMP
jgi:CHASE2 domain-containing sensor protein